jgi:hypothetical protein
MPTYNESDYLAVGPLCWARAKSVSEALRILEGHRVLKHAEMRDKGFNVRVYRLSDDVDDVVCDMHGSFSMITPPEPNGRGTDYAAMLVWERLWDRDLSRLRNLPADLTEALA